MSNQNFEDIRPCVCAKDRVQRSLGMILFIVLVVSGCEKPASENVVEGNHKQKSLAGSRLELAILANRRDHAGLYDEIIAAGTDELYREDGSLKAGWREWAFDANGVSKRIGGGLEFGELFADEHGRNLVVFGWKELRVTGQDLSRVFKTVDEGGRPAIRFSFNKRGAYNLAAMTAENQPSMQFNRQLGIFLNGKLHSAPYITGVIPDSGMLTGKFTEQEIDDLITILEGGDQ